MPLLDSGLWLWEDWLGLQDAATTYLRPQSVEQLLAYLSFVTDPTRLRIRAIGAGHSTSDVARPYRRPGAGAARAGIVVRTDRMALAFAAEASAWWRPGVVSQDKLMRVEAGASIATLNRRFFDAGLAFPNLGSYDQQAIAGALATATHGTGMVTPPLCDLVASIELVTFLRGANGQPRLAHLRIEPRGGPTDRAAFEAAAGVHGMELWRDTDADDDAFYSAVVGLGMFGIVTAVTLRLTDRFWLKETQRLEPWSVLRTKLPQEADQDWFDFTMTARPTHNGPGGLEHKCLVTTRTREASAGWGTPRNDARRRKLLDKGKSRHPLTKQLAGLASQHPRIANFTTTTTFEEEANESLTPNRSASHHILRTSIGDLVLATSAEVSIPFDQVVPAIDALIAHCAALEGEGLNHTSPFGVRFSQASKHYVAMAYGRKTCTIEAPLLQYTKARGGPHASESSEAVIARILSRFEAAMRAAVPSARFHHGQRAAHTAAALDAYPKAAQYRAQHARLDPFGLFANDASRRLGLTP
ncbi:MAG: FAD-binding protein [Sandaracinaceae bacterium]|nr:FAD-binding protein [Sandaracinaceae bacterium]